jgi:hypothetical protein
MRVCPVGVIDDVRFVRRSWLHGRGGSSWKCGRAFMARVSRDPVRFQAANGLKGGLEVAGPYVTAGRGLVHSSKRVLLYRLYNM